MGKTGIPGGVSCALSHLRFRMETSGGWLAGSGKRDPPSAVSVLRSNAGGEDTVTYRGTRRTAVAADIYIVFLEYGDSSDPKGTNRTFSGFGDSDRAFGTDVWLPFPTAGNLSDRRISAGIAFHGADPWRK